MVFVFSFKVLPNSVDNYVSRHGFTRLYNNVYEGSRRLSILQKKRYHKSYWRQANQSHYKGGGNSTNEESDSVCVKINLMEALSELFSSRAVVEVKFDNSRSQRGGGITALPT